MIPGNPHDRRELPPLPEADWTDRQREALERHVAERATISGAGRDNDD